MRFKAFVVAFACVSCLAASLIAHHSHGNYDVQTWTTMEARKVSMRTASYGLAVQRVSEATITRGIYP